MKYVLAVLLSFTFFASEVPSNLQASGSIEMQTWPNKPPTVQQPGDSIDMQTWPNKPPTIS